MGSEIDWPRYLLRRVTALPPTDCFVIDRSTPVIAFGNPVCARVATLGINPSSKEFLDRSGSLMIGAQRRLVTLDSLDVADRRNLNEDHARSVLDGCADYFNVRSYAWFKPLNWILAQSIGASYGTTACHLNLAQWATHPVWRTLNATVRWRLIDDGVGFLESQLVNEGYRLVIANGRTVMNVVEAAGITSWTNIGSVPQNPTARLYVGERGNQRFLGWSCNLQSQPGARRHVEALIEFVRTHCGCDEPIRDPEFEKAPS